jgi:hypothetical protein
LLDYVAFEQKGRKPAFSYFFIPYSIPCERQKYKERKYFIMELQHDNWVKFLNAILRKMTVNIEVIFIGGRAGNIFVRWPNMLPYLGIEILRSLKSYTTWIEGNWWSSGNEISRCNG